MLYFVFTGYTTPAPGAFPQQGGGELSPHSGMQPPGGFSSIGAGDADPASAEKKKAAQQAYQEDLKRQVQCSLLLVLKSDNWISKNEDITLKFAAELAGVKYQWNNYFCLFPGHYFQIKAGCLNNVI